MSTKKLHDRTVPRAQVKRKTDKLASTAFMFHTHDPLEDLKRAERGQEDHYFHKFDQELIVALREKTTAERDPVIRTYTCLHCPKCNEPLEVTLGHQVKVDACPGCGGMWLYEGKREVLVNLKEGGWIQQLFKSLMGAEY